LGKKPDYKITWCMTSFNRLEESKINIRRTSPHVDRTIIIDGGSWDGSVEFFNSQECKDLNVECYVHPWKDNAPEQRQKYLDLVTDGWILILDCDELLEIPALYQLKYLIKQAEDNGCDGIAFCAYDIQIEPEGGIYASKSNYYNRQLFKASRGMQYIGHTHVALYRPGMRDRCMKTDHHYFHIKPWADVYFRACRNYWTTAAVAANTTDDPKWKEFKGLVAESGFQYFYQFAEHMKKGNIDEKFKKWFIDNRESENPEARSWFVSYFMFLHPDENVDKIENRDLKYDPDRKPIGLTA
jgi:glycosyltransferase involved in cell wall biosynthesis